MEHAIDGHFIDAAARKFAQTVPGIERLLAPQPAKTHRNSQLHAPALSNPTEAAGFVYVLTRGYGVLITKTLDGFHIPLSLVTERNLKTGDFATARVISKSVTAIIDVKHATFEALTHARPAKSVKFMGANVKLGSRLVIRATKKLDTIAHIAEQTKRLDGYKIVLLIDENDDCTPYLTENGANEVYIVRVNFDARARVLLVLYALFTAKERATAGETVFLIVESLNKLFKCYNASMSDENLEATHISLGALTDLKTFFMAPKQIDGGASLTMVSYIHPTMVENERNVMDELVQMANTVIDV
jgi:hypothetical protein